MAARFKTATHTLSGDPENVASIFTNANDAFVSSLVVRAARANAGSVTWHDSAVGTAGGFLDPGEAVTVDLTGKFVSTNDIYFDGTLGDVIYLTVVG